MKNSTTVSWFQQRALWSLWSLLLAWLLFFWPALRSIFFPNPFTWVSWSSLGIFSAALILIYQKRQALENTPLASSQLGLVALFLLAIGFVVGGVSQLPYVGQSAVMLMLPAVVMTALGPAVIRTLWFPLVYLILLIPLQDETLQYRWIILWIAPLAFLGYLRGLKGTKPQRVPAGTTPAWIFQNSRWLVPTTIAFSIMMISPWLTENVRSFYPEQRRVIMLKAPAGFNGWRGPMGVTSDTWKPRYDNASAVLQAEYYANTADSRDPIYLYSAYYYSDRPFTDLLTTKNAIFDPAIWKSVSSSFVRVPLGAQGPLTVFELVLEAGATSRVVWYWYHAAGVDTTDLALAGVLDKVRIISKYAQGSGLLLVSADFDRQPAEARARLTLFLQNMTSALSILKRPEIHYTRVNQAGK